MDPRINLVRPWVHYGKCMIRSATLPASPQSRNDEVIRTGTKVKSYEHKTHKHVLGWFCWARWQRGQTTQTTSHRAYRRIGDLQLQGATGQLHILTFSFSPVLCSVLIIVPLSLSQISSHVGSHNFWDGATEYLGGKTIWGPGPRGYVPAD